MRVNVDEFIAYAANHTPEEIANYFAYSLSHVYKLIDELKCAHLKSNHVFTKTKHMVEQMMAVSGSMTIKEAAAHFNMSLSWIYHIQKMYDFKFKSGRINRNDERDKKIRELVRNHTYSNVAERYGITRQRVEQIVNKGKDK